MARAQIAWLIALDQPGPPWAGIGAGLAGAWQIAQGGSNPAGGWSVRGAAMPVADVLIDQFVWASPPISKSDQLRPQPPRRPS